MAKAINKLLALADETVMHKIYIIRGQKVMIDRYLSLLYGVETRALKQAVKRNIERFPKDFMFEMNKKEFENWRSQIVISNFADNMGLRHTPFCFTEHGVIMLSCVLNSERAIKVNIQIIRIFTKLREMLITNKDILLKLEKIEKEMIKQDNGTGNSEENIQLIFEALKQLINPPQPPRPRIGFKP